MLEGEREKLIKMEERLHDPAEGLEAIWNQVTANLRNGAATAEDADIVNWLAKRKLISATDLHPDLAAIHEEGVKTAAQIGVPQFAMHSIRELAGAADTGHLLAALKAFFAYNG